MSDEAKEIMQQLKKLYPWADDEILRILYKNAGHVYDLAGKPTLTIVSYDVRVLVKCIDALLKERNRA